VHVTTYLGGEIATTLVVDYDEELSLPLSLEAYKGLMPSRYTCLYDESTSSVDFQGFFQQSNTSANTYKDIVTRELGGFCHYPINGKHCKCVQ
jgi:hypothetical protein